MGDGYTHSGLCPTRRRFRIWPEVRVYDVKVWDGGGGKYPGGSWKRPPGRSSSSEDMLLIFKLESAYSWGR